MQRVAGGFLQKRSAIVLKEQRDDQGRLIFSQMTEVIELPNGVWQFGRGRDAVTITSVDQVSEFGEDIQTAVAQALKKMKQGKIKPPQPSKPMNRQQETSSEVLNFFKAMTPEQQERMLDLFRQTLSTTGDSVAQGPSINSHADGYGDQPPVPVGADIESSFVLPPGCKWSDPRDPRCGYLKPTGIEDSHGQETYSWHETPEFGNILDRSAEAGVTLRRVPTDMDAALEEMRTAQ